MDGAAFVRCSVPEPGGACLTQPQFRYVVSTDAVSLNPYLELATQYGWANYMFQTHQGSSYPAHQIIFGATSAVSAEQDALGFFVSGLYPATKQGAGCIVPEAITAKVIDPQGFENTDPASLVRPCFERRTVADLLSDNKPPVTWRYYAPKATSIWTAPNSIHHICQESGENCTGSEWLKNVDIGNPANVLTDIETCNLRGVSWVIPNAKNSDHAGFVKNSGGPDWVASIVNAIGSSTCGYWQDTAIFITWDDWGGWYDHVPPTILAPPHGGYQFGFRVPLIVVSAYTPERFIDNKRHEFNSIIRFIEQNFKIGNLGLGDTRCDPSWKRCSADNLRAFFDYQQAPRSFKQIKTARGASYFVNDRDPPEWPDDDADDD